MRWQFGDPSRFQTIRLERGAGEFGPWEPLDLESLVEYDTNVLLDREAPEGRDNYYRLAANNWDGELETFGPVSVRAVASQLSGLARIGPNPSSGPLRVEFVVASEDHVALRVLDVRGRVIAVLEEGVRARGSHVSTWDAQSGGRRVPAGLYFVEYATSGTRIVRKVVFAR